MAVAAAPASTPATPPEPAPTSRETAPRPSRRNSRARVRRGNELQDASGRQVLLIDPHPEGRERVLYGVHYRGRRDEHAALAHAAEVDIGVQGHRLEVRYLDAGNVTGGRHQVVHERG